MDLVPKKLQTDQEQHDLKKVKKVFHIQTQARRKGHMLWEFDPETGELNDIPYPESTVALKMGKEEPNPRGAVGKKQIKENFMYFQCLNRKNAERKLRNRGYHVISVSH